MVEPPLGECATSVFEFRPLLRSVKVEATNRGQDLET